MLVVCVCLAATQFELQNAFEVNLASILVRTYSHCISRCILVFCFRPFLLLSERCVCVCIPRCHFYNMFCPAPASPKCGAKVVFHCVDSPRIRYAKVCHFTVNCGPTLPACSFRSSICAVHAAPYSRYHSSYVRAHAHTHSAKKETHRERSGLIIGFPFISNVICGRSVHRTSLSLHLISCAICRVQIKTRKLCLN